MSCVAYDERLLIHPDGYHFEHSKLIPPKEVPQGAIPCAIISCGSYNPIHTMHIGNFHFASKALVEAAKMQGETLVVVGNVISPVNDKYGKANLAPFAHRYALCQLATKNEPHMIVDPWEGIQPINVRTYYVLKHLADSCRELYPDLRIYFVCGADLFESFFKPGVWDITLLRALVSEFRLLVIERDGSKTPLDCIRSFNAPLRSDKDPSVELDLLKYQHNFTAITVPPNDLSSTKIRKIIANEIEGKLTDVMPAECAMYIEEHRLYKPTEAKATA